MTMPDEAENYQTEDDALEESRTEDTSNNVGQPAKEEDTDPPAAPPDDTTNRPLAQDHPSTDTNLDSDEVYNNGIDRPADTL